MNVLDAANFPDPKDSGRRFSKVTNSEKLIM